MPFDKPVVCPVLVGRVAYLEGLEQALGEVRGGRGQTVLITGEAGIGKSRLVGEVRARAEQLGFVTLKGHCFEPDRSLPYAPLLDLVRTRLADRSSDRLGPALGVAAPEFVRLLPELAALLPGLVPTPALGLEQEKHRLFHDLVQYFAGLAAAAPMLVVLEDLHWSDDTSLEFLLSLARRIGSHPILLLLTYRREEVQPALARFLLGLDRERLATEFPLARLAAGEVDVMIRSIFDLPRPVRPEFVETVYALTDGNPFFIEEILRTLVTSGEIGQAPETWDRQPISQFSIPRSVQLAVHGQLEKLSLAARHLLTLTAVAGRRFDLALLQALTRYDETELLHLMKQLIAAQLVIEESADVFAFRHALTRQAVISDLLTRERRAFHLLIAKTLERVSANSLDARVSDLAYHFYEAAAWKKAVEYSQRAGVNAQSMYAPRAAVEHLTRAFEAARQLSWALPSNLYRTRGQAHELLGDFEAARADYGAALEAAREAHDGFGEWQSLSDLGFLWTGRDFDRAGDYLQRALEHARARGDPLTLAHSLNRLGNWQLNAERPREARRYHQEALARFETAGDRHGRAATLDLLGVANFVEGDLIEGVRHYEQAVAVFRELNDGQGLVSSLGTLSMRGGSYLFATTVCPVTRFAECIRDGEEALQIARQMGWRAGEASALIHLALGLGPRGASGRALAYAQEALDIASEVEHRVWMFNAHLALGALHLDLLAPPMAREYLERALGLAREIATSYFVRTGIGFLALAYLAGRDFARAESVLNGVLNPDTPSHTQAQRLVWYAGAELALAQGDTEAALAISNRLIGSAINVDERDDRMIPGLWHLRGRALAAQGHTAEAESILRAAEAGARLHGARPLLWRISLSLGKVYRSQGNRQQAAAAFAAARGLVESLAAEVRDPALRNNFVNQAGRLMPRLPVPSPRRIAKQRFNGLTEREREVAALIAQGKANRAIAQVLILSERTVEKHVENILSKLGFASRAQIATWAVARELERHPH